MVSGDCKITRLFLQAQALWRASYRYRTKQNRHCCRTGRYALQVPCVLPRGRILNRTCEVRFWYSLIFAIITTIATSLHTVRPVPGQTQLPIPPVHWGYDVYGKDQQVDIQGGRSLAWTLYRVWYTTYIVVCTEYSVFAYCNHSFPSFSRNKTCKNNENENENREWILSHLAIDGDLLRSCAWI